ncbi:MAG: hypothetical protein GX628_02175 [Clostridiales bacterium]|nr:hypothetical protein [Clostridiales bacterium]
MAFKRITALIIAAAAVFGLCACGLIGGGKNQETQPETDPPVTQPVTTAPPPPPETTPAPETQPPPPPIGKNLELKGVMRPEKRQKLGIHIEWSASQTETSANAVITLKVYLDCYSILVADKNCTMTINGEEIKYKTPRISQEENVAASYLLATLTHSVANPSDTISEIKVWTAFPFGADYGSTYFGMLEVSGTILLATDEELSMIKSESKSAAVDQPPAETVTIAPETKAPETTAPEITTPVTTAPETAAPVTAAPETITPVTTVPEVTTRNPNAPELPKSPFETIK